jgi:hypothetical protein
MRRVAIVIAAIGLGVVCLAGCGGTHRAGRPATVDDLSKWMRTSSGCDVGVTEARAPSGGEEAGPAIQRFRGEASVEAWIECKTWLSGGISYYEFPSAQVREAAVQERASLRGNQLYCAKGPELVINELVGYDSTADFCRRLGFPIHHPTARTGHHL